MDIFKLFYEHDLRLDHLRNRHTDHESQDVRMSLEEFMKPDPTYSRFYLTGTRLDPDDFGLDMLDHHTQVLQKFGQALDGFRVFTGQGEQETLQDGVNLIDKEQAILLTRGEEPRQNPADLTSDHQSTGHPKELLREVLLEDQLVLFKENARNGYDLHLFCKENIYRSLFTPFQKLLSPEFRFFSINAKRIRSEQKFYFETWALERPPHGVEEVFDETVL